MAKNAPKTGKSARRGNALSPYAKYRKVPYKYNFKSKKLKGGDE